MKLSFFLFFICNLYAQDAARPSIFSARISKINVEAGLMRLRTDYSNIKFLVKDDQLEIYLEENKDKKCPALFMGKGPHYLIIKVPHFALCQDRIALTVGGQIMLSGGDFQKRIEQAEDVTEILLKKRLIVESKLGKERGNISSYKKKVDVLNDRYQILRSKLELEWQEELTNLEVDKINTFHRVKELENELLDLEKKLEQYRVDDRNIVKDRWSLDRRLYRKK